MYVWTSNCICTWYRGELAMDDDCLSRRWRQLKQVSSVAAAANRPSESCHATFSIWITVIATSLTQYCLANPALWNISRWSFGVDETNSHFFQSSPSSQQSGAGGWRIGEQVASIISISQSTAHDQKDEVPGNDFCELILKWCLQLPRQPRQHTGWLELLLKVHITMLLSVLTIVESCQRVDNYCLVWANLTE